MLSNYKKAIITTILLAISNYSFASLEDCAKAGASHNDDKTISECMEYANKNLEATSLIGLAYINKDDYKSSLPYLNWVINYSNKNSQISNADKKTISYSYAGAGNIYYFGQAGKADKTKGLEYITKAANLGYDFAQNQLGDFYASKESFPGRNLATAYKWYGLAVAQNYEPAKNGIFISNLSTITKQAPYCIGMGEQLVAQAYLDGTAGLSKDKSKAKKYLSQAIAIYKDNEPTKASYKYCAKQKGLDLASAEKLLGSL